MTFEQYWMIFIGAVITTFVGAISSYIKDAHKRHEEERRYHNETLRELVKYMEDSKRWREASEIKMKKLMEQIEYNSNETSKIQNGLLAIMRDRILQSCRSFKNRGSITMVARDNIRELYKWYSEMGGNGSCEVFVQEIMILPVDDTPSVPNINAVTKRKECEGNDKRNFNMAQA